jgi:small subunit ribosomal protein S17
MNKKLTGVVVSTKMENTAVVEVSRRKPHPLYKKLMKVSKKFKADLNGKTVSVGDIVVISETKPVSKNKFFKIDQIINK